MGRYTPFPLICTLLLTAFSSLSGFMDLECGEFEEEVECVDICNFCDMNLPCPKTYCVPGCDCLPGFSRDSSGNCIPWQYCDEDDFDFFYDPFPASGIEKRGNLLGLGDGCPSRELCISSCKQRGFKNGICMGPDNQTCDCFSKVPPEKTPASGIEKRGNLLGLGDGCPSTELCISSCKKRDFKNGICMGPGNQTCDCFSKVPPEKTPASGIEKRGNLLGLGDGCPSTELCISSCKQRGFKNGICMGPENGTCDCFSKVPPEKIPGQVEANDELPKPPNDHGCPNNTEVCINHCKETGSKTGTCLGVICRCLNCTPGVHGCPKDDNETAPQIKASGIEKRGNLLGLGDGCPETELCISSCKQRGFKNGICMGPENGTCDCFSQVPPEKNPGQAEADDEPAKVPNHHGCLHQNLTACVKHCNEKGFTTGTCDGKLCRCRFLTPESFQKIKVGARGPRNRHGCPRNPGACLSFCKSNKYETGICTGDRGRVCGCVDFL